MSNKYVEQVQTVLNLCGLPKFPKSIIKKLSSFPVEEWALDWYREPLPEIKTVEQLRNIIQNTIATRCKNASTLWNTLILFSIIGNIATTDELLTFAKYLANHNITPRKVQSIILTRDLIMFIIHKDSKTRDSMIQLLDLELTNAAYVAITTLEYKDIQYLSEIKDNLKILCKRHVTALLDEYKQQKEYTEFEKWLKNKYPNMAQTIENNVGYKMSDMQKRIYEKTNIRIPIPVLYQTYEHIPEEAWNPDFRYSLSLKDKIERSVTGWGFTYWNGHGESVVPPTNKDGWAFLNYVLELHMFTDGMYYLWKNGINSQFIQKCRKIPDIISIKDQYPELLKISNKTKLLWEILALSPEIYEICNHMSENQLEKIVTIAGVYNYTHSGSEFPKWLRKEIISEDIDTVKIINKLLGIR